jgi:hypothetical protein
MDVMIEFRSKTVAIYCADGLWKSISGVSSIGDGFNAPQESTLHHVMRLWS